LNLKEVPGRMVVIGGGVIGMEMGSVFGRLGSQIEVVEFADAILGGMDADLSREMQKVLRQQLGFKFHLGHAVKEVVNVGDKVVVKAEARKDGKLIEIEADYCLISIGRRPYTDALGLDKAGVAVDERGRVVVNDHLQTSQPHIFAIGDVVRGAMLAHKAEEEGVFVAEYLAGQKPHINYNLIPGVVYTWPEVSSVGKTEEELRKEGIPYKAGKFHFKALGRARASTDVDGFIKVLAHKETDEVLGVHMIGARVADIIMEAVAAMEFRASAEDIARFCHPHPTFTEALKEAALAATANRSIHA
jgi:dihydrolipoamide dehydrogenase